MIREALYFPESPDLVAVTFSGPFWPHLGGRAILTPMAEPFFYLDAYDRAIAIRRPMPLYRLPLMGGTAFTLLDLIQAISIVVGASLGFTTGRREFGVTGALLGGILGLVVGQSVGIAPWYVFWAGFRLTYKFNSIGRLRRKLKTDYFMAERLIAEMIVRGEPAESFWPFILSLLRSDSFPERYSGWKNLNIWFPRLAKQMEGFTPHGPTEMRSRYVKKIENLEPCAAPLPRESDIEKLEGGR